MEATTEPTNRRIALLLTAILGVLVLMTSAVLVGGVIAWRQYTQIREAFGAQQSAEEAAQTSQRVAEEIAHRQAVLSSYLEQRAEEASKELKSLHKRREDLGPISKGPLQKFDQVLQFTQLLSDQVLLLQRQINEVEMAAAKAIRPLPLRPAKAGVDGPPAREKTNGK